MFAGDVYKLLEGTADAAFVVTPEGEICFWNTAAEQLFGYSAADVLNKTCFGILKGRGHAGHGCVHGGRQRSTLRCPRPTDSGVRSGSRDTLWAANLGQHFDDCV